MTTMTFTADPHRDDHEPDTTPRAVGTADAHDDLVAGLPLHTIAVRAAWLIEYAGSLDGLDYALGYAKAWASMAHHTERARDTAMEPAEHERDQHLQAAVRADIAAMEEEMSKTARRRHTNRKPNPAPKARLRVVPAQGRPTVRLLRPLPARPVNRLPRERTEARAALDSAAMGLNHVIPVAAWTALACGTASALLDDDTRVVFTAGGDGRRGTFLAYTVQPDHSLIEHTINSPGDLQIARYEAQKLRDKAQVEHMQGVADWHAEQQEARKAVKAITPVRVLREAISSDQP